MIRRFRLIRTVDITGVSGTGFVAEGVMFTDGTVVIRWLSKTPSTVVWRNIKEAMEVHGHDGKTQVNWQDHGEKGSSTPWENQRSKIFN